VFYGETNTPAPVRIHSHQQMGLNLTAEFDNGITLRAGRAQGKLSADSASLDQLVAILSATPFAEVGNEISLDNKDASFTGVGIAYDQGNWVANAEYTKRKTSSYVASTTGWEATLGYRIAKFTPYVVVSQLKRDSTNVNNTIPYAVPQLAPLAAAVDGLIATQNLAQKTDSIGLRWDAYKNLDVKVQYDHIKPASGAVGLFNRVEPGFGGAVSAYSVAVDFVF
jgi:predicted porin